MLGVFTFTLINPLFLLFLIKLVRNEKLQILLEVQKKEKNLNSQLLVQAYKYENKINLLYTSPEA